MIFASSETLSAEVCRRAVSHFGVPVIDRYGQVERVCSAWALHDDPAGGSESQVEGVAESYYFAPACGHVELHWSHTGESHDFYEVIATSFWNSAQPMVRYRTGDLARIPKETTASDRTAICRGLKPFHGIGGRSGDFLISPDGTQLLGIDHIPRGIAEAVQVQVHQPERKRVEIWVLPGEGYEAATQSRILSNARLKIPESIDVEVIVKSALYRTERGKTPFVVRRDAEGEAELE